MARWMGISADGLSQGELVKLRRQRAGIGGVAEGEMLDAVLSRGYAICLRPFMVRSGPRRTAVRSG